MRRDGLGGQRSTAHTPSTSRWRFGEYLTCFERLITLTKANMKSVFAVTMLACVILGQAADVHGRPSPEPRWVVGVVSKVSDGDTLWVHPNDCSSSLDCKPVKVRIHGIDAPERCQAWGHQSAEALSARLLQQNVEVSTSSRDMYGRELGKVRHKGEDVGAWMVLHGNAWSYRYQKSTGPYGHEEQLARQEHRGLFADPAATEPRVFRKAHGACGSD